MAFKRDEVHTKWKSRKKLLLLSAALLIIFISLISILAQLFRTGGDPLVIGLVILVLIIMIPIAIFLIDLGSLTY